MATDAILDRLCAEFDSEKDHIRSAVALLERGAPPAFAARYRRHEVGGMLEERLVASGTTVEEAVRAGHQRLAMSNLSMGNSITSLRLCATLDWNDYVEEVSLIEGILQRDPQGTSRHLHAGAC